MGRSKTPYWEIPLFDGELSSFPPRAVKARNLIEQLRSDLLDRGSLPIPRQSSKSALAAVYNNDPTAFSIAIYLAAVAYYVEVICRSELAEGFATAAEVTALVKAIRAIRGRMNAPQMRNRISVGYSRLAETEIDLPPTQVRAHEVTIREAIGRAQNEKERDSAILAHMRNPLVVSRTLVEFEKVLTASKVNAGPLRADASFYKDAVALPFLSRWHEVFGEYPPLWRKGGSEHSSAITFLHDCFALISIHISKNSLAMLSKDGLRDAITKCNITINNRAEELKRRQTTLQLSQAQEDVTSWNYPTG